MDVDKQEMTGRVVTAVVVLAAAWAAERVIRAAWTARFGHRPPSVDDTDSPLAEVAAAAALTGAVIALARLVAMRGTTRYLATRRPTA
ncbi:MAG TPA: DUF4235 domain-containing protein [Actinotalea sp.]|nr:DUF4235 domain-containing protein [Actinotalea sp.]